jgi:tetratricopeptide (TPR) repeat protein
MSRRVLVPLIVLVVLAAGITVVATRAWEPLRYGRLDPPAPALDDLDVSLARAIAEATREVVANPYSAEAWGTLGGVFDVHDFDEEAIACYARAERLDPADFRWPYFLGYTRRLSDQEAALADLHRAEAIDPDFPPLHIHLGRAALLMDDTEAAERHFARAATLDPKLVRAAIGRARVAMGRDDPRAAIAILETALALGPESTEFYRLLEQACGAAGETEAQKRYAGLAVGLVSFEPMPDDRRDELIWRLGVTPRWRRQRSAAYTEAGRYADAVAEWEALLEDDPESAEAWGQIGLILAAAGRTDEAVIALTRSLELDRFDHAIRNTLGTLHFRSGRVEEGLELLRESCRFMPDSADAQFNLAQALRRVGRREEAREAFERTILLDGANARAQFELGVLLGEMEQWEDAAAALRVVAELEPTRRAAHQNLARALHGSGRYREAIDAVREGLLHLPDDPGLLNNLAWRLATCPEPHADDGVEAVAIAAPLCERVRYGDPTLVDTLAAAHAAAGDYAEAVRLARLALQQIESVPDAPPALRAEIEGRLALYESHRPYRAP